MAASGTIWTRAMIVAGVMLTAGCAGREERPRAEAGVQQRERSPTGSTMDKAGEIAAQPVRDIGIANKPIPPLLEEAANDPYAPPPSRRCAALRAQYQALNDVLGPDFDADARQNRNTAGRLAEEGGRMIVNSLIPFRGLVREISGAASADRKRAAAIAAGVARRGYLRGIAAARRCRVPS